MTASSSRELLVVAGEASGDLHGARLISELHHRMPDVRTFGLGGDEMRQAGLEPVAHSSEISVVGLTEVLKILPRAREIFADLLREVDRRRPGVAVLIDFPDFNLRLAKELKSRGVEVLYYISPQIWAWRRGRVKTISRLVDRMLVLFPFEVDFYKDHDVDVVHVGHPLVDEVPVLPQAWDRNGAADGSFAGPYRVALLPGSRPSEVEALLPTLLESVKRLSAELPIEARIIRAPTVSPELIDEAVELAGAQVEIVEKDRFAAVADSHLALCASGTATLEVGLLGTPMIMVYRLARWTYAFARLVIRLPNVSLINLVLGRRVVPELIQGEANPERIAAEAVRLLTDAGERGRMRAALAEVRGRLGEGGASRRAAGEVADMLAEVARN
ncbi:MAG TPA: lipid-A-disaccharide synthase [Thermoanaerobaculia bacterium]